jgi:predicted nucleotidyltransferase
MLSIDAYKNIIIPVLKRYAVKKASIFGSLAKGTMTDKSDIDLLIEPGADFTMFTLLQLEEDITLLTQHKTDIVEYSALKPSIKFEVEQTAIAIL